MYRLSDVAAAIDPENREKRLGALRNWFARGYLHYAEDKGDKAPTGAGSPAVISRHTLIIAAIAARLADNGIPPEQAVKVSRRFLSNTHPHMEKFQREFGGYAFKDGETILFVWKNSDGDYDSVVCKIGNGGFNSYTEARSYLKQPKDIGITFLDCGALLEKMNWLLSRPF